MEVHSQSPALILSHFCYTFVIFVSSDHFETVAVPMFVVYCYYGYRCCTHLLCCYRIKHCLHVHIHSVLLLCSNTTDSSFPISGCLNGLCCSCITAQQLNTEPTAKTYCQGLDFKFLNALYWLLWHIYCQQWERLQMSPIKHILFLIHALKLRL